jgi:hypothetical protein
MVDAMSHTRWAVALLAGAVVLAVAGLVVWQASDAHPLRAKLLWGAAAVAAVTAVGLLGRARLAGEESG